MRACRKDLFLGKVALRVDGNLASGYPNGVASRYAAALHLNRAAAERDLLARQVVLAVGGQQLPRWLPVRGLDVFGRWLAVPPQLSRVRFFAFTFRFIRAQQV